MPGRPTYTSEAQSEIGCKGLTIVGRSAGSAVTHSIAQQGPGEALPSCSCLWGASDVSA